MSEPAAVDTPAYPAGEAPVIANAAHLVNPLRDPSDRRLPRVPEPCALVVFGVTGDLSRKKLLPAIYDLANRGLLPTDFVLLGFARRDWGDGDFENLAKTSAKEHARTPWSEEVWKRLNGNIKFVPGSFDDDEAFDELDRTLADLCATHGITRQRRVLPLDRAGDVQRRARPDGAHRHGRQREATAAGAGSSSRSRSATTSRARSS